MLASEYITRLVALLSIYGDLPVKDVHENDLQAPEKLDGCPYFVLAFKA